MKTIYGTNSLSLLVLILCAAVAGCSANPSSGDGKQAVQSRIDRDAQGRIKLIDFRKINDQTVEVLGKTFYGLEFNANIEFTEDCKWSIDLMKKPDGFSTTKLSEYAEGSASRRIDDVTNPGSVMKKGQRVTVSGVIRFVKTENGWSVDGIHIDSTKPVASSPQNPEITGANLHTAQTDGHVDSTAHAGDILTTSDVPTDAGVKNWAASHIAKQSRDHAKLVRFISRPENDYYWVTNTAGERDLVSSGLHVWTNTVEGFRFEAEVEFDQVGKWVFRDGIHTFLFNFISASSVSNENVLVDNTNVFGITTPGERYHLDITFGFKHRTNDWLHIGYRQNGSVMETTAFERITCINNLKQIDLAFRVWEGANNDMYPQHASTSLGGTKEMWKNNPEQTNLNSLLTFQVMSNELGSPRILVCPSDSSNSPASDFQSLKMNNVTYRTHADVNESDGNSVIAFCPIHNLEILADGGVISLNKEDTSPQAKIRDNIDPQKARANCVNQIKQIALAFMVWKMSHNDDYPFQVTASNGGSKESCVIGKDGFDINSAKHFQVMAKELEHTDILVCPSDSSKKSATNFQNLQQNNVSYEIHSDVDINNPKAVLLRCPLHNIVLLVDGSVQQLN